MERRLLAAVLLTLWAALAQSGVNTWTGIGPAGGTINEIVRGLTPGTVFALSNQSVYRSQDSGMTWQVVKSDFPLNGPRSLAIDPSDAARVYVVAPEWPALYVSTDGGSTFNPLPSLPTAVTQASQLVVSEDGRTLYVSNLGRLFRSVDRGQNWTEATPFSTALSGILYTLRLEPGDPSTLYAAGTLDSTQAAVLRSRDAGQTWTVIHTGPGISTLTHDIAVSVVNPTHLWIARTDGVFRSTDRGATWTGVRTGEPFSVVATDATDAAIAIVGSPFGSMLRTTDGGASWQDITNGVRAGQPYTVSVDPANRSRILVGGYAGLWGTLNAGSSWSARYTGIFASAVDGISADTASGRIYFNVASDGLYYATGAAQPQAVDNVELDDLQPGSQYVVSMLAQPGRLFASLSAGLARSTDGGNSWSIQLVVPGGSQQLFDLQSSPLTPLMILATGTRGVYRSTDGGLLWTVAGNGLPAGDISRMRVAPSNGNIAYASLYSPTPGSPTTLLGIHRSNDGGLNWVQASGDPAATSMTLLAVDPAAANTIYATSDSSLRRSTDAGSTWSSIGWNPASNAGQPSVLAVDPRNSSILYAANFLRVARSVDGGATWETLRSPTEPHLSPRQLFVDPFRAATLLMSTSGSGVQHFAISPDLQLSGVAPVEPTGLGIPLVHTFTLRNQGPFDATSVVVNLHWPATAQDVTLIPSAGNCTKTNNTASCSLPILRNGATVSFALTATTATSGSFEVEASASASEPDTASGDNAIAMITTVAARADLAITVNGPATAQTGAAVNYTLTVRNTGPNTATAPKLTFQLAAGLTAGAVTPSSGSCSTGAAALISCTFGDLATNATVTVGVAATASATGTQISMAQLTSSTADAASADNNAAVNTTITAPAVAPPPAPASGGGGATSRGELLILMLLAALVACRRQVRPAMDLLSSRL